MDLGLTGKVALVTAASRGLGKAAALALAREGSSVVMSARSEALNGAAEAVRTATGSQVSAIRADVTSKDDIASLVEQTIDSHGRIDILVINAGGPPPGTFLALQPDDWEAAIELTLTSAVRLCYAVIPHMLKQGSGSIVATQSVTVKQPIDNLTLSNSLRMSVIGLMKSLATELGPQGIRVNSINPGWTYTERVEQLLQARAGISGRSVEEEMAAITGSIPLRRMGTVEEYGQTIAWLASPAAAYVHGHALIFDGGLTRTAL